MPVCAHPQVNVFCLYEVMLEVGMWSGGMLCLVSLPLAMRDNKEFLPYL